MTLLARNLALSSDADPNHKYVFGLRRVFYLDSELSHNIIMHAILFSIFINEFGNMVENSGINDVLLFPELTEIVLLMFADDLALIVDTVQGLQC